MIFLLAFNAAIGVVLYLLTFFQVSVSLSSTLKEDAQELGVLRAIGLKQKSLILVVLYEQLSTLFSAIILATIIGLLSSSMVCLLLMNFAEMPFVMMVPYSTVALMILMGLVTIILGTYFGVKGINSKSITSILKGLV
jgi:ABC-type antimicrobial peptide transport system permease subunit